MDGGVQMVEVGFDGDQREVMTLIVSGGLAALGTGRVCSTGRLHTPVGI